MKYWVILLFYLGVAGFVHASTDCSTGCDVSGASFFDTNIGYLNWDNPAHDASLKIKDPNGAVVATKSTADVVNWGASQLMPFYPQWDGNYSLEVFSQGLDNNYQLKLDFNSLGTPSTYQDTNCTGTGCGGSIKTYKFNVSDSPATILDDNQTVPFSVKGGTVVVARLKFLEGSSCLFEANCDVYIGIRHLPDNNMVAYVKTPDWPNWSSTPLTFDWNVTKDGNYAMEVWFPGSVARYDLNFSFIDTTNNAQNLSDYSQWIGSSLATGTITQYFFRVSNTPSIPLGDEKLILPPVKGGSLVTASLRVMEGSGCSFEANCDASIAVRRLSDSNVVAYVHTPDWPNWNSTPRQLTWWADYDDNYALEIVYGGEWSQYDLNVSYTDTDNSIHLYSTTFQYFGSSLATGNTARFPFLAANSPTVSLDDGKTVTPSVKGNTLLTASVRFIQGADCSFTANCDVSIGVRRISDNSVVAHVATDDWPNWSTIPRSLQWWADTDDQFSVEVWFEGAWSQYDMNVSYTDTSGNNRLYSDNYQYIGSSLSTGNTSSYFFAVNNSPPLFFSDGISTPYKLKSGVPFFVRLRMYDGSGCSFSANCDANFAIKDTNGSTVTSLTTGDYPNFNNVLLQFKPISGHDYFIETWFEGAWVKQDLNIDFQDTADINHHFEDKYQYLGSSLSTGKFTDYYFGSGPSCGNGIECASETCIPIILNGDQNNMIDLAFIGSGFPSIESLKGGVDFAIDYDGDENGLFSFEPFKSNRNKFNVWYVELENTYTAYSQPLNGNLVMFGYNGLYDAASSCPFADEFSMLSIKPRIWAHAFTEFDILGKPTGAGAHWNFITLGCEFLGDCNYPLDINPTFSQDPLCDGNGGAATGCDIGAAVKGEHQRLFVHEFGHSFGGLLDEYIAQDGTGGNSGGAPNCVSDSACIDWNSNYQGITCNLGCTYSNWYRPYPTSLMETHEDPRQEFLAVNEDELSNDIANYPTGIGAPNSFLTYLMNIQLGAEVKVNEFNLFSGSLNNSFGGSDYTAQLLDATGQVLFDFNFDAPTVAIFEEFGIQNISDVNVNLRIPYISAGKTILILDSNGSTLLKYDIFQATDIDYALGYGGGIVPSPNYTVKYSVSSQPVGIINSSLYVCKLGADFLYG